MEQRGWSPAWIKYLLLNELWDSELEDDREAIVEIFPRLDDAALGWLRDEIGKEEDSAAVALRIFLFL